MKIKSGWIRNILIQLGLITFAAFLFAGSFPNPVFTKGLPFLAWIALIPALLIIKKNSLPVCIGWGVIYGCLSYALFNYWLGTFHPMAGIFVYFLYSFYMAVVFFLFKISDKLYPKHGYIIQWTIWIAYEYLRTCGFLGYSYGVLGYSQWQIIPLIQIAGITGVWGVSALVTFPSFWLAKIFSATEKFSVSSVSPVLSAVKDNKIPAIIWAAALTASLIFGFAVNKDYSNSPTAEIALIQHNTDPWKAARAPASWQRYDLYRKDLAALTRLSNEALASNPNLQLVVWPETAFIPRIYWHSTYRDDQNSWLIVKELLDYLAAQDVPFLIGNDDGRMDPSKNPNANERHRIDYNAAMLYLNGKNTAIYRKLHLVPFTEHFPYRKQLPFIYNALLKADTYFWEKGEEKTVFYLDNGFSFSAPICFEDTFGYLSRDFVRLGAEVLVNLTNDAWADSLSSQNQHLSMAVFRSVENSRSLVRSTVSGQTCAIDPAGRIIAEAPAFTEAWLNVSVPISKKTTIYTLYGDFLAYIFIFAAFFLLIFKAIWGKIKQ
ncbi:MAG: apolipoprotein N-acyltransferase [Treponema sp.]|jgi:apolipoprotein N-acyltransferase|nr:apolipoprotein N-acyltransferase [Treponema sp.]